jgi:translation initiation factor 3 subunit D
VISPQWSMLEEIEFHRLAKLRLEVDEPVDLYVFFTPNVCNHSICRERDSYGRLFAYDKSYDRITTKTERPLQLVDRIRYNTTTSDDPVIQEASVVILLTRFTNTNPPVRSLQPKILPLSTPQM